MDVVPPLVSLGYGKFVRADRVFAVVPLERGERKEGQRTQVWVEGMRSPLVASRSERAIVSDIARAMRDFAQLEPGEVFQQGEQKRRRFILRRPE